MIKNNQKYLNGLQYILDILMVGLSLLLAYVVRFNILLHDTSVQHLPFSEYMQYLFVLIPIYVIAFTFHGLYKPQRRMRFYLEIIGIVRSMFITMFVVLSLLFINKEVHYSRAVLVLFNIFIFILMTSERGLIRYTLRWLRRKGYNLKHIIIVGSGALGWQFAEKIINNPQLGYNIVGFIDQKIRNRKLKKYQLLGNLDNIDEVLGKYQVDELVIALPIEDYSAVAKIISRCEYHGVKAQIIPAYQSFLPAKPYFDNLEDIPLINIRHVPLDEPLNAFMKRIFDICFSFTVIVLLSPFLLVIALLVKLTSPGPIIFKQERVGINRKHFNMYKFRSMRVQTDDEEKDQWTTKDDPRKTKFGSFIRKTSIDELPQFFNVLKGEMSVIGPRPERPYFVEQFRDEIPKYMIKHHVRPGITGWAQINGWRGDTSIKKRIEYDIYYIENWTLGMDIQILFKTLYSGFVNKNAY